MPVNSVTQDKETTMTIDKTATDKFLNELRESGVTNMFGDGPYLISEFGLSRKEARTVLLEWMASYSPSMQRISGGGPNHQQLSRTRT